MIITTVDKQGRCQNDLISEDFTERRRIWITQINDDTAKEFIVELEYLDRTAPQDITVCINSPGGSVSAGLAMYDAMKRCRCGIVTVATGMAASMGAFLFACGGTKGKRFVTPHAEIMIHQPLGGISGQATEIELAAKHILRTKSILNRVLAEACGRTEEEITLATDRDCFLTAGEAVEYGLADAILT